MGSKFWQFDKFPLYRGRLLNKGLRDWLRDLNVLVFLCCTCVAPTQSELSDSEVITFVLFVSLGHVPMKFNHTYTFKPYIKWLLFCRHLLQTKSGEPLPEDEWPSEDRCKGWYPELFLDSSSELEDEREQVGHRRKVNRGIVLPWFFKNPFHFTCFSNFI